ncbi:DUF3889 domain-containing protein [Bacillaceae bacterium W0354]
MYYPYRANPLSFYNMYQYYRQNVVQGQATWTEGGQVTKCGIPWSDNRYMTVAVSPNSGYQCGQTIKVRNPANTREVLVEVVDTVPGFPANQINLHRQAFEALGARPEVGVINIEIIRAPELEEETFGKYLLEITQVAYPGYRVVDYSFRGREQLDPNRIRESYEFVVESPREKLTVLGNVVFNPVTNRVVSFDLEELD